MDVSMGKNNDQNNDQKIIEKAVTSITKEAVTINFKTWIEISTMLGYCQGAFQCIATTDYSDDPELIKTKAAETANKLRILTDKIFYG